MQHAPPFLQEARLGHLVGQGVLELVPVLREEPPLVEETSRFEPNKPRAQLLVGGLADFSEQGNRDVPTNHRRRLKQSLLLGLEPVDPGGEQRLHRYRDVNITDIRRETVGTPPARAPVSARVWTLSSRKKGFPSVRSIRKRFSGARPGSSPTRPSSKTSTLSGTRGAIRSSRMQGLLRHPGSYSGR